MTVKNEISSFRINSSNLNKLKKEAKTKGISLNVLLNQVIDEYVNFISMSRNADFVKYPRPVLMKIMAKLSEDEARKIGKEHFENDVESILCMLRKNYHVNDFLDALEYWANDSCFSLRHDIENDVHNYVIRHNMGKNWSCYMSEFICRTLEELTERKSISKVSDDSVSFSVDLSKVMEKEKII